MHPASAVGVALALGMFTAASLAGAEAARVEHRDYVSTNLAAWFYTSSLGVAPLGCPGAADLHVGGACFDVHAGERRVHIDIQDAALGPASAEVDFFGNAGGAGYAACGGADFAIPSWAVRIEVVVYPHVYWECPVQPSVAGTITASFLS